MEEQVDSSVGLALVTSRLVASFLDHMQLNHPSNFGAAITALLLVASFAALVASLRASRVDPSISLRQE
jgi:ABC-type antimicrobial peptide transport system permease subunit